MNELFENDYTTLTRRLVDLLPHGPRRTLYRILRPKHFSYLQAMRLSSSRGRANRLTRFVETRSIFLHIPKCAGRSVRFGLYDGVTASHMTMHNFSIAFSAREFRKYLKFTVVRNPWDRLYSAYRFLMAGGLHKADADAAKRFLAGYSDFEMFVMEGLDERAVNGVVHFRPMCHFAEICPGWMPLDRICRFEQLDSDLQEVAEVIGIRLPEVPWENRTLERVRDFREIYTDEMVQKVASVYSRDVKLYGYRWPS